MKKNDVKKPLLAIPEWTRGRDDGQFDRETAEELTDLYMAGYSYGALEREVVLGHLMLLFLSKPGFLESELERREGIKISAEDLEKGTEHLLIKYLGLLWPEASRRG